MKKTISTLIIGFALASSLMGCTATAATPKTEADVQNNSPVAQAFYDENNKAVDMEKEYSVYTDFGLTYYSERGDLHFNGKLVRCFEDFYSIDGETASGKSYFNKNGIVDVVAERDFSILTTLPDGSVDPSGKLTALKALSQKEFDERDISEFTKSKTYEGVYGVEPTTADMEEIAKEYKDFGVTFNPQSEEWFFNGKKIRYFKDVMTTNGHSLESGKYNGSMRTLGNGNGEIDVYTVRDFTGVPTGEVGKLVSIEIGSM